MAQEGTFRESSPCVLLGMVARGIRGRRCGRILSAGDGGGGSGVGWTFCGLGVGRVLVMSDG